MGKLAGFTALAVGNGHLVPAGEVDAHDVVVVQQYGDDAGADEGPGSEEGGAAVLEEIDVYLAENAESQ